MPRILYVEDSPTQAAVYSTMLERAGYTVEHVTNASEAVTRCYEHTPDLVLLDQYLAGESGLDVCRKLKNDTVLTFIPVVVLTASHKQEDELVALEVGANAFVSKETTGEALLAVLERQLLSTIEPEPVAADGDGSRSAPRPLRVLTVDDSRTYLEKLKRSILSIGLEVTTATSGAEALELLDAEPTDIVVTDIVMPDMDGYEVCRRARKWAISNEKSLGLLVLSGQESSDVLLKSLEAGADDFVRKSQDMRVIVAHVKSLVRRTAISRQVLATNRRLHDQQLALRESEWHRGQAEERARHTAELQEVNKELERSNEKLNHFAYAASHDLKAPLRGIDNLANWIAEEVGDVLPETSTRHLRQMQQRVRRMEQLLDDLLVYSKVGQESLKIVETDTAALVRETIDLLGPPEKFTISIVSEMPVLRTATPPLAQCFRNLIGNAIKHHNRESGRVDVSCRDAGEFVEFSVADDGPGIAPEFHERIFKMFQTLRPRDEVEGSGIGLALIKRIVEGFGGSINVESAPAGGTVFRFTWPKQMRKPSDVQ